MNYKVFASHLLPDGEIAIETERKFFVASQIKPISARRVKKMCFVEVEPPYSVDIKLRAEMLYQRHLAGGEWDRVVVKSTEESVADKIRAMFAANDVEGGLELLSRYNSDAVLIQSRHNHAKRQYSMGMIDFSEWSRTRGTCLYKALNMANKIESYIVVPKMIKRAFLTKEGLHLMYSLEREGWAYFSLNGEFVREASEEEAKDVSGSPDTIIVEL